MAKKIIVSLDLGGSLTKAIVRCGENIISLVTAPQVVEVNKDSLDSSTFQAFKDSAQIYVGYDDRYYAVGDAARTIDPQLMLRKSKTSVAVPKVLGLIWLASRTLSLGKKFSLDLRLLLPPSEYGDREILKENLLAVLPHFETVTGEFSVDLKKFDCYPEGFGIASSYLDRVDTSQNRKCLVAMFGHRNLSFYLLDRGSMTQFHSSTLGFNEFLKQIESENLGYERDDLAEPIAKYLQTGENRSLKPLLRQSSELHEFELDRLQKKIEKVRVNYCQKIIDWFAERIPLGIQDVVLSGGTFELLGQDFEVYWESQGWNVYSHAAVKLPDYIHDLQIGYRMADVYCLSNID
jgi:hypothetical protein